MGDKKKLLLVRRGLGPTLVDFLSKHFEVINPDIPEPTDDEAGGIAILTSELNKRYDHTNCYWSYLTI